MNNYQENSRVLNIFVPSKSFGQLLDVSPQNVMFLKTSALFSSTKRSSICKRL